MSHHYHPPTARHFASAHLVVIPVLAFNSQESIRRPVTDLPFASPLEADGILGITHYPLLVIRQLCTSPRSLPLQSSALLVPSISCLIYPDRTLGTFTSRASYKRIERANGDLPVNLAWGVSCDRVCFPTITLSPGPLVSPLSRSIGHPRPHHRHPQTPWNALRPVH